MSLIEPVAPPLAARKQNQHVPKANQIAAAVPRALGGKNLLIETFGGPFSPLNDHELQLALLRELNLPRVLISSTRLGGVGRTLQSLTALRAEGLAPSAVVLLGERDPYTDAAVRQHAPELTLVTLSPPAEWTSPALAACAENQREQFLQLKNALERRREADRQICAEDRRCVWHPYTPLVGADEPLVCVGAEDEFLELADGRRVIDGISSWWTILHGHRHPPLMQALTEASRRLDHVLFAGVTHLDAVALADLLLGTMPWVGGRVFYSDNGSTAVEVALKMAYQFWCHHSEPERTRFVGFEHGYHGDTFGAMAVSRDPVFFGRFEPLLFQADILPLDPERLDKHLDQHARRIAAVIVEPLVQGAGGMRMHSPETLQLIADTARFHGVLFIADEVMTGGGRTGTLWAHQAANVVPDLLCAAKTLTGGMLPLAATLASPKIVEAFASADRTRTFFHGHSFTANPLACAVAACNLRLLLAGPLTDVRRIEQFWRRAFAGLPNVRIQGTIAAIEVEAPGGYLSDVGQTMRRRCLEQGVFLRPLGNVLYALPPYCTSDESLERIAEAMMAAMGLFK
jgi:adenosylmethionine-8-amino-7-oxononanoate aminotransferase